MKYIISILLVIPIMSSQLIFDFNKNSNLQDWRIVDDVVMGGESSGSFTLNSEGHGEFSGKVSIENNGGFSSVRYGFKKIQIQENKKIVLRLKGDGKAYQFRIKSSSREYYSYITSFETSGEWQEIEINLEDMYPSFRGRRLDLPNFSDDQIEEITFLIGNKLNETFKIEIDEISLTN